MLETCEYTLVATSKMVMEQAKHNMRFRVYNDASYNFSDLAALYVKLHRWSEAKWYYLQSNNISREQNDDKHTMIQAAPNGDFLVNALTPIAEFNERFGCDFSDEEFDTVGGMLTAEVGHLPEVGEEATLGGFHFHVTKADARRVQQFAVRVHEA